ncbi:Tripeptidyl aminopeptidase [Burkholderiaceae bacterium]|nr:Tripeptidyl aminopeptidase [Burkholderiaceae bacterium]
MTRRVLAAIVLAIATLPAWAAETLLTPCRVAGIKNEVKCGVLKRPLDPAQPQGTAIEVHVVVVPAMARNKLPDPVFLLAGGPGQSAISVAPQTLPLFTRLNNRRDIVFVDQRGTGRSAPLACEDTRHQTFAEQADPQRQLAQMRRCRDRLQALPHGDLRMYTTTIAMQDLEAVRQALGAARINLVGVSYGTRAALEYQRQFPAAVRRSVLDGVAPPDMVLPLSYATDGEAAFEAVFAACEAEPACGAAHPQLRTQWATLLASLPKAVTLTHALTGRSEPVTLTREMLFGAMRGPLYSPTVAAALPQAISEAAAGRYDALVGLGSLLASRKGSMVAMGMHLSVICAEDYPRMAGEGAAPQSEFGRDFTRLYREVCADWPRGEVPAAFYGIPASRSPVLALSGGIDPVTPPRHGERAVQALGAKARHVVVPNGGHGLLGLLCMREVLYRFIDASDDAAALAVDAGCAKDIPRPPAYLPIVAPTEGAP